MDRKVDTNGGSGPRAQHDKGPTTNEGRTKIKGEVPRLQPSGIDRYIKIWWVEKGKRTENAGPSRAYFNPKGPNVKWIWKSKNKSQVGYPKLDERGKCEGDSTEKPKELGFSKDRKATGGNESNGG